MRSGALLGVLLSTTQANAKPPWAPLDRESAQGVTDANRPFGTVLEIDRAPGSEPCPDADAVFDAMARLFPERALRRSQESTDVVASARIVIRPVSVGHEALLTVTRPRAGERVILEREANCSGLADALAVAFVLLVDPPEPQAAAKTSGEPPTPAAASPSTPTETNALVPATLASRPKQMHATASLVSEAPPAPEQPRSPRRKSLRAEARAGALGGIGLLSEPSLGAALGGELFHQSGWGVSVQGLRLWSGSARAQGGSVTLSLWAGMGGPCYRQNLGAASSLDACLRLGGGAQHARVEGFLDPNSRNFPWFVVGPMLRFQQNFGRIFGGVVSLGALGQLLPQAFDVMLNDGGTATAEVAAAPKAGLLAELGLAVRSGAF